MYPRSAYFDDVHGRCFLEIELFSSDLLDGILSKGALDDARATKVAGFLAAALDYLHRRCVAHCDIKLENVFIRDRTVKLGDLGGIAHIRYSATTVESTTEAVVALRRICAMPLRSPSFTALSRTKTFSSLTSQWVTPRRCR